MSKNVDLYNLLMYYLWYIGFDLEVFAVNNILSILLTLTLIVIVVILVAKKYNSVFVFLFSGIIVLLGSSLITGNSILGDNTVGNPIIDVFVFVKNTFTKNASGTGMTLMMVTGYAIYMSHMGASKKLAHIATKPLKKVKNPYIVLSLIFIIGCMLKLVITSHSGLSMLLISTTFPILISLGISRLSTAVIMIFAGFCDYGPNDSSAIFAAENISGMPIMDYFLTYQGRVAGILIIVLAIFLPIYLGRLDRKHKDLGVSQNEIEVEEVDCPAIYVILPLIPLLIVTVFSFIESIKMDVITANIIGLCIAFLCELIRRRDRKEVCSDISVTLKAMGTCFANIVSILIGAAVFAEGVKLLGGITIMSNILASMTSAPIVTMLLMSLITFSAGVLLGSGNASWYAFGPLVPDVATQIGVSSATITLPMQLSSGIGRCISPVAGAMIAVSGMAEVDHMKLVKACIPPALLAFTLNIVVSYVVVTL